MFLEPTTATCSKENC